MKVRLILLILIGFIFTGSAVTGSDTGETRLFYEITLNNEPFALETITIRRGAQAIQYQSEKTFLQDLDLISEKRRLTTDANHRYRTYDEERNNLGARSFIKAVRRGQETEILINDLVQDGYYYQKDLPSADYLLEGVSLLTLMPLLNRLEPERELDGVTFISPGDALPESIPFYIASQDTLHGTVKKEGRMGLLQFALTGHGTYMIRYSQKTRLIEEARIRMEFLPYFYKLHYPLNESYSFNFKRVSAFEPPAEKKESGYAYQFCTTRAVSFKTDDGIKLAGVLALPRGPGPFPVVLMHRGAGPGRRGYQGRFENLADFLAEAGIASFFYDKRGVGESGGFYNRPSLTRLAKDAGAAVDYLSSIPAVDSERIAFLGHGDGVQAGLKLLSIDPRVKTGVLCTGVLTEPYFPDLVLFQIKNLISPLYRWDQSREDLFIARTVRIWQKRLDEGRKNVRIMDKTIPLHHLRELAGMKPVEWAKGSDASFLILMGDGAPAMIREQTSRFAWRLKQAGKTVKFRKIRDTGHSLTEGDPPVYTGEVQRSIRRWLKARFGPGGSGS